MFAKFLCAYGMLGTPVDKRFSETPPIYYAVKDTHCGFVLPDKNLSHVCAMTNQKTKCKYHPDALHAQRDNVSLVRDFYRFDLKNKHVIFEYFSDIQDIVHCFHVIQSMPTKPSSVFFILQPREIEMWGGTAKVAFMKWKINEELKSAIKQDRERFYGALYLDKKRSEDPQWRYFAPEVRDNILSFVGPKDIIF
mgnify:CR=1 FL=1